MAIGTLSLRHTLHRLNERPVVVLGLVTVLTSAYIIWQAAEQWFDRPLPASTVAARQLQVDSAGNDAFQERLTTYRRDSASGR